MFHPWNTEFTVNEVKGATLKLVNKNANLNARIMLSEISLLVHISKSLLTILMFNGILLKPQLNISIEY